MSEVIDLGFLTMHAWGLTHFVLYRFFRSTILDSHHLSFFKELNECEKNETSSSKTRSKIFLR